MPGVAGIMRPRSSSWRVRNSSSTPGIGSAFERSSAASDIATPPSRSARFSTSTASSVGRTPLAMPRSVQSSTPRFWSTSAAPLRAKPSVDESCAATSRQVPGPRRTSASFAAARTDHPIGEQRGDRRRERLAGARGRATARPTCASARIAALRT